MLRKLKCKLINLARCCRKLVSLETFLTVSLIRARKFTITDASVRELHNTRSEVLKIYLVEKFVPSKLWTWYNVQNISLEAKFELDM